MATKVAIIGSGNIGTDLMIKVMRTSKSLEMGVLVGIDPASDGLARARKLGVATTELGVDGLAGMAEFKDVEIMFDATSAKKLNRSIANLRKTVPQKGTNLESLFRTIGDLSPLPDNVYLIVDGLPTQGSQAPRKATISGRDRLRLFREATKKLPPGVPLNIIMFPMEGDPAAAAAFWDLSQQTGGSFLSPSRDWP